MDKSLTLVIRKARVSGKRVRSAVQSTLLSYPMKVQCIICGWTGRRFLSDAWHHWTDCPRCRTGVRHRLPFAALQNIDELSFNRIIRDKRILHFAPEEALIPLIRKVAAAYVTADFFRKDCNLQLDMSSMPQVKNESFDVVIAFDVLEHVPDYQRALEEIHRILSAGGYALITVPQKDHLPTTYEDPSIVTGEERLKHFGQIDHLRIFGNDFPSLVESKGFVPRSIDESNFSEEAQKRYVLFPPVLSKHPLATNYRKAFFFKKA